MIATQSGLAFYVLLEADGHIALSVTLSLIFVNLVLIEVVLAGPPARRRGGRLILPELGAHYRLFSPERTTRALNTLNLV